MTGDAFDDTDRDADREVEARELSDAAWLRYESWLNRGI